MSKISDSIVGLSSKIAATLSVNEDGVVTSSAKDLYAESFESDEARDAAKAANKHRDDFIAATTLAVGELAEKQMKANKDLQQVSFETKMFDDRSSVNVKRSKTSPNPQKSGETITTYGATSNSYVAQGARNVGGLKQVRNHIKDQFKALAE